MDAAEHYSTMISVVEVMNANIEFWLAATFAVAIAFHFASNSISTRIYWLVVTLYIFASTLSILRFIHGATQFVAFNQMLLDAGHQPYPTSPFFSISVVWGSILMMLVGTIGCVMYMRSAGKRG